jgi:hypothetical protein
LRAESPWVRWMAGLAIGIKAMPSLTLVVQAPL